jgi:hypothetical protein
MSVRFASTTTSANSTLNIQAGAGGAGSDGLLIIAYQG